MVKVKCPKCKKLFPTYAQYTKHFAKAHHKKKADKGKKKGVIVGKIPHWAKGNKR